MEKDEMEQKKTEAENGTADQSGMRVKGEEETAKAPKKKGGRSPLRMGIGAAIMLVGIGVCLYPFYRQKKSDDFNQDAINRILTPQPDAPGNTNMPERAPSALQDTPVSTEGGVQSAQGTSELAQSGALPCEGAESAGADLSLLGEDLLENPDAPDGQEEETAEEKENANRLGGKTVIGVIQIPKIELIYAIVEGSDAAEIGVAIGHMSGTAQLGEIGNCALAGHRGGYSGPYFKNLDKLEIGDEVVITNTSHEVFTYQVTETMVVEPDEVWVVEDTGEGVAMLTLVTCENSGAQRLIVRCVVKLRKEAARQRE